MSRCFEWTSAYAGLARYIQKTGIKTNRDNWKVEDSIFNNYCRENNIKGSFSTRTLLVSENFKAFKKHIDSLAKQTP